MPKDRRIITRCENSADKKISTLPQVETANILGFQFLKIVNLKCALLNDFKTFVHWQIISLYHYKY